MTSTVVFQVSRFLTSDVSKSKRAQLRLKERYNSQRDKVTALATLHLEDLFLRGMHYAYKDAEGELFYSFDKEDENIRVDYNINFYEAHLTQLLKQIESMGELLTKPSKDENGVSELRGVQLHVVLKKGYETSLLKLEDDYSDKLIYQITPQEIEEVKLVCTGEAGYVEAPGFLRMSGDLAVKAIYKPASQAPSKPQTLDEAKSAIANLTKAQSRGKNRQAAKAARQASRGVDAMSPKQEQAKVSSTNSKKIVISDDEDDDQPE